jgi:hypothetical protein
VNIANNGQKYSIGTDYLTATVPLLASSTCPGTVVWTLNFFYQTSGTKGTSIAGPFQTPPVNLGVTYSYQTQAGTGGRINADAAITIGGQTTHQGVVLYVDGPTGGIPNQTVSNQLYTLYVGGGRQWLMTGVAETESGYMEGVGQFATRTLFTPPIQGLWPHESYDGGSHIGLMQMPTTMSDGYSWQQNTTDGVNLFASDKLRRAGNYENLLRMQYTSLRSLTLQETELDALVFYGPGANSVSTQNAYWVPNAPKTDWVVNNGKNGNSVGVNYVNQVLSSCGAAGHPGCQ